MINKAGLALIKEFEGEGYFKWYPDPAHGWKVPTVGYGHTDNAGPPYYKDTKEKKFTQTEIDQILLDDLARNYEPAIKRNVKVSLNENQYAALVSFVFNLGEGNFKKSTLLKKINAKDFSGAADEFAKWNKAGGKVLKGLTRRRAAEKALFLKPSGDTVQPVEPVPSVPEPPEVKPSVRPSMGLVEVILYIINLIFGRK